MRYNFSIENGYEEVPNIAKLGELTDAFKKSIYNSIHTSFEDNSLYSLNDSWLTILKSLHTEFYHETLDTFNFVPHEWLKKIKLSIFSLSFNYVFDLVQFLFQHNRIPPSLRNALFSNFNNSNIAYEMLKTGQIIPRVSEYEAEGIKSALNISQNNYKGSHTHILEAVNQLNAENFRLSITESISAIESVLKVLVGKESVTMEGALNELHKKNPILHPSLKVSLSKLYAYTSDEAGLRHSFYEGPTTNVESSDALFMLTSCAAFITFLHSKFGHLKAL